ncbi:uncharacterized protein LOC141627738 [Silene latifolia]|uniref:uncharacterized protein LOC141627738 n=1 Tax=Silene latifolia TaxID=37657 RepID=UPI003D7768C1
MDVNYQCHLCSHNEVESLEHLFRDCLFATRIWAGSHLGIRAAIHHDMTFQDWIINWISFIHKMSNSDDLIISLLCCIWVIWSARTNAALGDNSISLTGAILIYEEVVARILNAKIIPSRSFDYPARNDDLSNSLKFLQSGNRCKFYGSAYRCDQTCIFVDAAWRDDKITGLGWCVKYQNGSSQSFYKQGLPSLSPDQAEAVAILEALKWASKEKILHVVIYSDCLQLLSQILDLAKPSLNTRLLVADILYLCCLFHCVSFCFIPMKRNKMAHMLAQKAINL